MVVLSSCWSCSGMEAEAAGLSVGLSVRRTDTGCRSAGVRDGLDFCKALTLHLRNFVGECWPACVGRSGRHPAQAGGNRKCPVGASVPGRRQSRAWAQVYEGDTRICRHTPETRHGVGCAAFASASRSQKQAQLQTQYICRRPRPLLRPLAAAGAVKRLL